jgi:hypothetical protein
MKQRIAIGGMAGLLAVAGAFSLGSMASAKGDGAQGLAAPHARAAAVSVIKCDGGKPLSLRTRIVNTPFVFTETGVNQADQAVPGATLAAHGPAAGTDTFLVTFSAETQVTGGDTNDWMGLEVHLDGTPIQPFTASGDVLALSGEPSWNSNSMQFCVKVGPGPHHFDVMTNLSDFQSDSSLNGWLDDYTVSFQRFD